MAGIVNGYCTVAQVKARIDPSGAGGTLDDAIIEDAITTASRMLDHEYRTRWYTTAADETRYYTADKSGVLWPDIDIISITTLATDADGDRTYEDTWAATDYDLLPHNAALDGEPYTHLRVTPDGSYSFPVGVEKGVKILGKFGYCTAANCPADVMLACTIQSAFLLMSSKAALGIVGGGEMGQEIRLSRWHPLVTTLMAKYRRVMVG
jgi:hypothetical protein